MFESHPIPQQISSYQFRLVGDMTLKQFFQLAGGALISLLFYSTGLHPIIKWPLMILSVGLGAALAFLPFEERPLSRWMIAFFRSIYSPTLFTWIKAPDNLKFFADEDSTSVVSKILVPQNEALIKTAPVAKLDNEEKTLLDKITGIFQQIGDRKQEAVNNQVTDETTPPPAVPVETVTKTPTVVPPTQPINIPTRPKISITEEVSTGSQPTPQVGNPAEQLVTPTFSPQAAPPSGPMIPNTLSGQVLDTTGGIIEGAILEIRDIAGRPVRALRSNKAGHFMVVTALSNGDYEIITEKDNFEFDPVAFKAAGEMIPPILIKAKNHIADPNAPYTGKPLIIN